MTLNYFKIHFPVIYQQYCHSPCALQKQHNITKSIRDFLYKKGVEIILTPDENDLYYFPTIKFIDNRPEKTFAEYKVKSWEKALSYGLVSAIAYLETGFYN